MAVSSDSDGPVYVASSNGTVAVLSDAPWIDTVAVSPSTVRLGEDFVLSFRSSSDGTYDVRVGGSGTSTSGSSVATGEHSSDEDVEVTLTAADLDGEGLNQLFVLVTAGGATGVDSISVTLDLPPNAVGGFGLEAGQARVVASWDAGEEPDLSHYLLYVSDAAFTPTDDTLPTLAITRTDGSTDEYPMEVQVDSGALDYRHEVLGLTNGVRYYAAIQAVDVSDQLGALSSVGSAEPNLTGGVAAALGETPQDGCGCDGRNSIWSQDDSGDDDDSAALLPLLLLGFGIRRRVIG
jgi:hypothetical protein